MKKLLDLFCGAGGAAMGYHQAGFEVVGVDIKPQPRYPFEFHQADAFEYLSAYGCEYDVIHASPPCQRYSRETSPARRNDHLDLIASIRAALLANARPFVLENVRDAQRLLREPLLLCGSMFGLPIHRHRLFEVHPDLPFTLLPPCGVDGPTIYITGTPRPRNGGRRRDPSASVKRQALGTDWMTIAEMDEAIPPAYTKFIGLQLLAACQKVNDEAWKI